MKLNPTSSKLFNIFYSNIEYHTPELNTAQVKLQMYVYNLEEQIRKLKKRLKDIRNFDA
jgi:hypothetical protein